MNDEKQRRVGEEIYRKLLNIGEEVVIDDRNVSPGVKFKDADLVGFPVRINVGKSIQEDKVELKVRYSKRVMKVSVKEGYSELIDTLKKLEEDYDPHSRE